MIFEETLKNWLNQWGMEAASTRKTVGKAFKVVGGHGRGQLLLFHTTSGPFHTGI